MTAEAHIVPRASFDIPDDPSTSNFDVLGAIEQERKQLKSDIFVTTLHNTPTYILTDPALIDELVRDHSQDTKKPGFYDVIRDSIGNGLITLDGDEWWKDRQLVNRFFVPARVRPYTDNIISVIGRDFASSLRYRTRAAGGELTIPDLEAELAEAVFQTNMAALLGKHATSSALQLTSADLTDFMNVARLAQGERSGETQQIIKSTYDYIGQQVLALVDVARAEEPDASFLSVLANMRYEDTGEYVEPEILRREIATLAFAGQDATTRGLLWTLIQMNDQHDLMRRIREEVRSKAGDDELKAGTQRELSLVERTVEESLRLRPLAPLIAREAINQFAIGGATIEPGNWVVASLWSSNHHEAYWEDPETFNPDRFLKENAARNRAKEAFRTFSIGPRHCLGMGLARATIRGYFAELARSGLEIETSPADVKTRVELTLGTDKKVGAVVRLR